MRITESTKTLKRQPVLLRDIQRYGEVYKGRLGSVKADKHIYLRADNQLVKLDPDNEYPSRRIDIVDADDLYDWEYYPDATLTLGEGRREHE